LLPSIIQNESSRKVKKKHLGKATIELAKYAHGCGESEFSTHFLKFDLTDDKTVCAKVTATLKIRRDPTGELYGTSRLSTASHSSVGRYSDGSDDDDFQASEDGELVTAAAAADEAAAAAAAAAASDAQASEKTSNGGDETPDADAAKRKKKSKSSTANGTPKHPEGEAPRRVQDKELAMFTPPPRLRRTVSSGQHDPLNARREHPDIVLDAAEESAKMPVSPRTAAMSLVSTSKLALTRRASVDGRAIRVHASADDVADADTSDLNDASDAVDRVVLRASESIAINDSHSTPQRSLSRQASGSPPEQMSPSRRRSELTRMESLRADNLRKYGQRRRNDGDVADSNPAAVAAAAVIATVSTSPRQLNSPPTLKNTVSDTNLVVGAPSNLLREKDAELERLKSQLAQQQREDDRRFFVEEAIVFMEPAYGDDGLPVSAYVIFRTLVHWDVFDGSNARFVVSVLDAFEKVLKRNAQNREVLLYGLATCAALQHLLRTELPGGATLEGAQRNTGNSSCGASDVDPDGSVASSPVNRLPPLRAFIEQLGDVAHAFFVRSIELLLSQTDTLLVPAILEGDMANPERNAAPKARLLQVLKDWHNDATQVHHLHAAIVEQLFYSVFDELGARLFNALLERRDLCSCGNGLQTKMNVSAIEQWANSVRMNVKPALAPIMQAADVLAMNKTALLDAATRADVCPELNPTQLHRLLTLYAPDDYDPEAVHPGVLKQLASLASDATRPLHRRAQVRRCDARLGRRRFDLGLAALRTPRSLLQRPGFAFLGASAVAAAAAAASSAADADEPW
jgi:hypothetical protein